jgi:DHHC palmitoyltransferase
MAGRRDWFQGRIGTSFHAQQWLSLDAFGLCGVAISWLVHFYALICIGTQLVFVSGNATLFNQIIYVLLYIPMAGLAMYSLFAAWTTDPGAIPMGAKPLTRVRADRQSTPSPVPPQQQSLTPPREENVSQSLPPPVAAAPLLSPPSSGNLTPIPRRGIRRCHKCSDNFKPPRAHHDSVTGRCIHKFDHFCPWYAFHAYHFQNVCASCL